MLEKPISWIFGVLVLLWVLTILSTTDPQARIDRTCLPVGFLDRFASAAVALADPDWGSTTHRVMQEGHYGCRLVVWRVFYEDDWRQNHPEAAVQPAAAATPAPTLNQALRRMANLPAMTPEPKKATAQ